MKFVWSAHAITDVREAYLYIAAGSPKAAKNLIARIGVQVSILSEFPMAGRSGRVPGTRELVISKTPYVVAYRITSGDIEILAVLHGARR